MPPMSARRRRSADKLWWRSLEQRAGEPRALAFLEREFPEGAAEPPQGIDRRTMLTLLGASLSLAGLAGCRRPVEQIVPYVEGPENVIPGVPKRYATTVPFGLSAYGVLVESHEGRPTKIEGNPLHPSSRGGTNAFIQASVLDLYDPDRSRRVLRDGAAVTWADFVAAWAELDQAHRSDGGAGLAVLSGGFASPTLGRLADALAARFPASSWATYDAVSDENVYGGLELATGSRIRPLPHYGKARVIVSLDCDFLQTEGDNVSHARDFADGRRVRGEHASMNRLWAVEGAHSLTGANADHRMPLRSGRIGAFVGELARRLAARGLALELPAAIRAVEPLEIDSAWLDALVKDLLEHRGAGLIVAGRRQPAVVHAAVYALNAALGNVGTTLTTRPLSADERLPDRSSLAALVQRMSSGGVSTLVILGGNPVYDAPADLGLADALARVRTVVHASSHVDETSRRAHWHLPRAHYLESWGDARCADGTLSVVQPLILPLFGAKSDVELLGLIAGGEERPGYDLVRESWRPVLGDDDFERRWSWVLHQGLLEGAAAASAPVAPLPSALDGLASTLSDHRSTGLELVFCESPALYDGRFANNGWLQELPDAMTKMTWDNAALLAPATARRLGLVSGELARVSRDGAEVEMPVWVVPGQAEESVVLPLGYGRRAAGRIGDGVGFDVYPLRGSAAPDISGGGSIAGPTGTHVVASTQDHGSMEGRPLVREATVEEFHRDPEFAQKMVKVPHQRSMWREHQYTEGYQWGMTIDLNACTGCGACVVACQSENNVPVVGKDQVWRGREMHWLRVDRYFAGSEDNPETVFQAVPCMQCENAPCEQVCPVAATVHDSEGLNVMVYNRCIGTRYCANNCPYKVRRFNFYNFTKDTPEIVKMAQNPDVTVRSRGVMEKCTYCVQRLNAGRIDAKLEERTIRDGEVQTACQQACPTRAIEFGNILDEDSRVSRLKQEPRNYALLEELYTKPRTTYLARLRNPHPDLG